MAALEEAMEKPEEMIVALKNSGSGTIWKHGAWCASLLRWKAEEIPSPERTTETKGGECSPSGDGKTELW